MATFKEIGINDFLIEKLEMIGVHSPTAIQATAMPQILNENGPRKDVFACSETGSGKSLAYILPILNSLMIDPRPFFALILTPTRELSYQVNEVIKILTRSKNTRFIKSMLIIGGNKFDDEDQSLWEGKPNIVVATPGRLLYFLEKRNFLDSCGEMSTFKFDMLVLDEADQLITPSFSAQLKQIIAWIDGNKGNRKRQTLVFSATLTPALDSLRGYLQNKNPSNQPVIINLLTSIENIKKELSTNPFLDQRYILCPVHVKTVYLIECLLDVKFKQLIIFCDSKRMAKIVYKVIVALGFDGSEFKLNPVLLNSDLKQKLRFAALDKFKSLKSRILVTTDLASRGLDLPLVDLVINYNCPKEEVTYIHRVGRTCRRPEIFKNENEKKLNNTVSLSKNDPKYQGKSITFVSQHDIKLLKNIEESVQIKLKPEEGLDEANINKILRKVMVAIKEAELEVEQEELEKESSTVSAATTKRFKAS